jgi:prepilin-type N-terminal cleavage/methylation domain-containing protein
MEYLRKMTFIRRPGFTLVEILVAMGIFVLIFLISGDFIVNSFRTLRYGSEFDEAVDNARRAVESISKEIRGANISDRGDYPIALASGQDLIFYSDIDYDGDFDRVQYYVDNRTLYKVVTQPGATRDYSGASATTTIAHYINNGGQEAFIYYDGSVAETSDLDSIRLVRIHLLFNVTPGVAPDDILVETDVHLRNLKSNL